MPQYMLLLHQDPSGWSDLSPEAQQQAMEKYMAWTKKSTLSKRLAPGPGRVIRPHNGHPRATDGPYAETKEHLGGFYMIEAPNYDEAVRVAMDHPHVEYGGTIEIREVFAS